MPSPPLPRGMSHDTAPHMVRHGGPRHHPRPNRRSPDLDARCKPQGRSACAGKRKITAPAQHRKKGTWGCGGRGGTGSGPQEESARSAARIHRRSARAAPLASMIRQDAQADDARKPSGLGRRHTVAAQSVTARREKAPPTSRLGHRRKSVTEGCKKFNSFCTLTNKPNDESAPRAAPHSLSSPTIHPFSTECVV